MTSATPPGPGKRAGARRATRAPRPALGTTALLAAGITLTLVAWGYLVSAAIDFGTSARNGASAAWFYLGLASLGAIACLFVALMLATKARQVLLRPRPGAHPEEDEAATGTASSTVAVPRQRHPGGHRRAGR